MRLERAKMPNDKLEHPGDPLGCAFAREQSFAILGENSGLAPTSPALAPLSERKVCSKKVCRILVANIAN